MEEIFNQIKDFFTENPRYFYLLAGLVFLVLSLGHFFNKNWAIDPASSAQRFNYQIFGHNAYRFFMGIILMLGFIAFFFGFLGFY